MAFNQDRCDDIAFDSSHCVHLDPVSFVFTSILDIKMTEARSAGEAVESTAISTARCRSIYDLNSITCVYGLCQPRVNGVYIGHFLQIRLFTLKRGFIDKAVSKVWIWALAVSTCCRYVHGL